MGFLSKIFSSVKAEITSNIFGSEQVNANGNQVPYIQYMIERENPDTNISGSKQLKANRNQVTYTQYTVKGKNPDTNRKKTVTVTVESAASLDEVQMKSGLLPPYEIEKVDHVDAPTERQVAYAEKLGFAFPPDATMRDASIFLTRYEEDLPLIQPAAPDKLVRYLIGKGIAVPAYAGINEISNLYCNSISASEISAFFCMRVFCSHSKKKYHLLEDAPPVEQSLFYRFGELHKDDSDFLRSLTHYSGKDLPLNDCPSLKKLKAYEIATSFLKDNNAI